MWIRSWFLFFKQKTAYEMRISDWSSDVCSSDLTAAKPSDRLIPGCRARIWLPSTTSTDAGVWTGAVSMRMASTVTTGSVAMVRSEERRVGKSVSVRVDLGGRRIIKKKNSKTHITAEPHNRDTPYLSPKTK